MKLKVNGEEYLHDGDGRLDSLLREMELGERKVALVVNEQVVPAAEASRHRLREGDCLDILTLAGGG